MPRVSPKALLAGGAALALIARAADGSARDVTHLADFSSNEKALAEVDEHGVVTVADATGEAAIVAHEGGEFRVRREDVFLDRRKQRRADALFLLRG